MVGRAVALILAVAAGCGRLDFAALPDAAPDGPTLHDEDGDGIPDLDDPCPHVAGDRADRDGDGVGDACDPNPDAPTEHWVLFATMQPGDQPFDDASAFDQRADALHVAGNADPRITRAFGTARIDIGFTINGLVGTGQHQVAAGIGSTGAAEYYFGELNDNAALRDVAIVQYDGTIGYTMLDTHAYPGIHPGAGSFRLDAVARAPPSHHLLTGWIGEMYASDAPTPTYAGGTVLQVALNGLDVDIRYVAIIATGP